MECENCEELTARILKLQENQEINLKRIDDLVKAVTTAYYTGQHKRRYEDCEAKIESIKNNLKQEKINLDYHAQEVAAFKDSIKEINEIFKQYGGELFEWVKNIIFRTIAGSINIHFNVRGMAKSLI